MAIGLGALCFIMMRVSALSGLTPVEACYKTVDEGWAAHLTICPTMQFLAMVDGVEPEVAA
jgi:hypothetical protein